FVARAAGGEGGLAGAGPFAVIGDCHRLAESALKGLVEGSHACSPAEAQLESEQQGEAPHFKPRPNCCARRGIMTAEEFDTTIVRFLHETPFRPFVVELLDGREIWVTRPGL